MNRLLRDYFLLNRFAKFRTKDEVKKITKLSEHMLKDYKHQLSIEEKQKQRYFNLLKNEDKNYKKTNKLILKKQIERVGFYKNTSYSFIGLLLPEKIYSQNYRLLNERNMALTYDQLPENIKQDYLSGYFLLEPYYDITLHENFDGHLIKKSDDFYISFKQGKKLLVGLSIKDLFDEQTVILEKARGYICDDFNIIFKDIINIKPEDISIINYTKKNKLPGNLEIEFNDGYCKLIKK